MGVLIKIIQLILALSILVIVHEFGHFIAARIFKTRVDKFYIFFNPKFSILRFKKVHGKWRFRFFSRNVPESYIEHVNVDADTNKKEYTYEPIDLSTLPQDDWRTDEDHTEFGIGWIPLGGYCKIAGMIDESMDMEQMDRPAQSWEFRSKPAWQRLIIMVGGVFMNVVLAVLIFIGILSTYGEQYLPTSEVNKYGIAVDSLGQSLGFRNGDKILSVNGEYVEDFHKIPMELILEDTEYIEVERDGKKMKVMLPSDAVPQILKHQTSFISYRMPFVVGGFSENSIAENAGVEVGDMIVKVNDINTPYYQDFTTVINQFVDTDINISVVRNNDTITFPLHLPTEGKIGVYAQSVLELKTQEYTLLEAVPQGVSKTMTEISDYWKQLKLMFKPDTKAYESLGGFISIGKIFPDTFNWYQFWRMTAFLSIILAVMNILPIPALDGGHVLFLIYELITRRKPSDKFLQAAQMVGLAILLMLMVYANGNDIIRLFR